MDFLSGFIYNLYTLWLFTYSDLKTIVVPSLSFAALQIGSHFVTSGAQPSLVQAIAACISATSWAWINLLPFNIDNQRSQSAIEEDKINKPWRPLPSGRISTYEAKQVMLLAYLIAVIYGYTLGVLEHSLLLVAFGYLYNDLHAADTNCILRNVINAAGYSCFTTGSLCVALEYLGESRLLAIQWIPLIIGIIGTTIHVQDIPDQAGDAIRGRYTVPLCYGDQTGRLSVATATLIWTFVPMVFWRVGILAITTPLSLATLIVLRLLKVRYREADQVTFRLWNAWLVSLFAVPLIQGTLAESGFACNNSTASITYMS